ncbi:MAG: hypothetical protein IJP54_03115 [Synergistaceae bacterium]|nr:hypothetical protein [Synergistaceae bacterium]
MSESRQKTGRPAPRTAFKPGQSGNPGGRPKIPEDVREATRAACPAAIKLLVKVMKDEEEKTAYRLDAAKTLLDRGYGKPMQMQDISLGVTVPVDVTAQIRRLMLKEDIEAHAGQETNKN